MNWTFEERDPEWFAISFKSALMMYTRKRETAEWLVDCFNRLGTIPPEHAR